MTTDRTSSEQNFIIELDPHWCKHGEKIRNLINLIDHPLTQVGEERLKEFWSDPVIRAYTRLHPIIGAWIVLVECEQIGEDKGKKYLSEPENQINALKAFKVLIENKIKSDAYEGGDKSYETYKSFFENLLSRLNQLEEQIEKGIRLPNFLNSLGIIMAQEISKLSGTSFNIEIENIRKEIKDYLPRLKKIDEGEIYSAIEKIIEEAFVEFPSRNVAVLKK